MATYTIDGAELTAIADAIRAKLGVADTYTPSQMAAAIATISGGSVLVDNPSYFVTETIDTAQKIATLQNAHTFTALFITDTLTHCTSDNAATSVEDGQSYAATITPDSGYAIDAATVTMGGIDITSTAWSNGVVTIASVTGDVAITVSASVPYVPPTNQLPLATESDGTSIYPTVSHSSLTTVGYAAGYRIGSSGTESAASGKYVTGFIPVSQGDVVTFENMTINAAAQDNNYIAFYKADHTLKSGCSRYASAWATQTGDVLKPLTVDNGNLTGITLTGGTHSGTTYDFSDVAYMRVACNSITSASAIYVE